MAIREINFGLPPPPGARKEQFYYDYADGPPSPPSREIERVRYMYTVQTVQNVTTGRIREINIFNR